MLHSNVVSCVGSTPMVHLQRLFAGDAPRVYAKLEFLNPAGSVKDRAARYVIERGVEDGVLKPGTHVVESTSGNFGIALAMMASIYDLRLTLVVDPNITASNLAILRSYGASIEMVDVPAAQGGYLEARIDRVQRLLAADPSSVWINQYANALIPEAHYQTAAEILADVPGPVDYLVLAVSTTGTLVGIARRLKQAHPRLRVVAVDAVGSVVFGTPAGPRALPGIGASRVPELLDMRLIDQVIHVTDDEAIAGCWDLVTREAIFGGGSSGSVIAAIKKLVPTVDPCSSIVTLLPDRGDRYLDLVYRSAELDADPAVAGFDHRLPTPNGGSHR